jgi:hypothetical protein
MVENSIVLHFTLQSLNIFRAFQKFEMPHSILFLKFLLHLKGTCYISWEENKNNSFML